MTSGQDLDKDHVLRATASEPTLAGDPATGVKSGSRQLMQCHSACHQSLERAEQEPKPDMTCTNGGRLRISSSRCPCGPIAVVAPQKLCILSSTCRGGAYLLLRGCCVAHVPGCPSLPPPGSCGTQIPTAAARSSAARQRCTALALCQPAVQQPGVCSDLTSGPGTSQRLTGGL